MSTMPSVIVKKGGFLSAVAYGLFGLLITAVICATGLGSYGMYILDSNAGQVLALSRDLGAGVIAALPEWQKALPPVLADALRDRRDPDYRAQVRASVHVVSDPRSRDGVLAVIEVTNEGPETVSLMTTRVTLEDDRGVPVRELSTFVATPLALSCEDEWRGPLLPNQTRRFSQRVRQADADLKASIEITELRLWTREKLADSTEQPEEPAES